MAQMTVFQGKCRISDDAVLRVLREEPIPKCDVVAGRLTTVNEVGMDYASERIQSQDCIDRQSQVSDVIAKRFDVGADYVVEEVARPHANSSAPGWVNFT
jgi:hypothetical protein